MLLEARFEFTATDLLQSGRVRHYAFSLNDLYWQHRPFKISADYYWRGIKYPYFRPNAGNKAMLERNGELTYIPIGYSLSFSATLAF